MKLKKVGYCVVIVPLISIALIIIFRYKFFPTNDEIIAYLRDSKGYISNVEYTIINDKGEYKEEAIISYNNEHNTKISFQNDITKIYNDDGSIRVEDRGYEYSTSSKNDTIYSLAIINNILQENDDNNYFDLSIKDIYEETDEWGDKKYIVMNFDINEGNKHISTMDFYIEKKERIPVMIKIYDDNNAEKAKIVYKCFKYI